MQTLKKWGRAALWGIVMLSLTVAGVFWMANQRFQGAQAYLIASLSMKIQPSSDTSSELLLVVWVKPHEPAVLLLLPPETEVRLRGQTLTLREVGLKRGPEALERAVEQVTTLPLAGSVLLTPSALREVADALGCGATNPLTLLGTFTAASTTEPGAGEGCLKDSSLERTASLPRVGAEIHDLNRVEQTLRKVLAATHAHPQNLVRAWWAARSSSMMRGITLLDVAALIEHSVVQGPARSILTLPGRYVGTHFRVDLERVRLWFDEAAVLPVIRIGSATPATLVARGSGLLTALRKQGFAASLEYNTLMPVEARTLFLRTVCQKLAPSLLEITHSSRLVLFSVPAQSSQAGVTSDACGLVVL